MIDMAKTKQQPTQKRKLTTEEREDLGKWARRVSQSVREFEKAAGKTVNEDELRPWNEISEDDREIFRKGGEIFANDVLPSEQAYLDQLARTRAEMGEKAFRQKMFSICIDVAVERIASNLSELERHKAAEAIVGLSGMLDVPNDEDEAATKLSAIKEQLARLERKVDALARS